MSKEGLPTPNNVSGEGIRVAVVTATWNAEICDQLHRRALETAEAAGAAVTPLRVVGALELPVVAQAAARTHDAVVALGCVVRGGTPHFDYVCDSVTEGLTRVALDEQVPVGNGVLTVENFDQAIARTGGPGAKEDKGAEAMDAALSTALTLARVRAFAPRTNDHW